MPFQSCTRARAALTCPILFRSLAIGSGWRTGCLIRGMTLTLIVIALQVVVTLVALLRESGEDTRFEGDKLTFRS